MYPLQNQVRALPGIFVPIAHSKAIVFDQKLFRAVPSEQRRHHQENASYQPKGKSAPADTPDDRLQAVLSHQAASARKRLRIFSAAEETFPAPSVMMRSPGPAALVMASTLSSMLPR